jgi:hypothetical protein
MSTVFVILVFVKPSDGPHRADMFLKDVIPCMRAGGLASRRWEHRWD